MAEVRPVLFLAKCAAEVDAIIASFNSADCEHRLLNV